MTYTFSLALVDFLPVLFTAVGLYFLARMVGNLDAELGRVAAVGAVLTVAGGALKATWKLIMAASGGATDIGWMDDSLFVFMAPGYVLLFWAVYQAIRVANGKRAGNAWIAPGIFIAAMFALSIYLNLSQPASPAWERVLLSIMVLATTLTGLALIYFAFRQKLRLAGILFIINLIGIFLLNGLARMPEQTIALQWIEEGINTISWLAFAVATYQVYQHTRMLTVRRVEAGMVEQQGTAG